MKEPNAVPQGNTPTHAQRSQADQSSEARFDPFDQQGARAGGSRSEISGSGPDRAPDTVNTHPISGETPRTEVNWPDGLTPALCREDQPPTKRVWW